MKKDSAEDYLDGLLQSVSEKKKGYKDTELAQVSEEIARLTEYSEDEYNQYWEDLMDASGFDDDDFIGGLKMKNAVSRRVSKSEADFLMEFESELKKEEFDDYLMNLDDEQAIPKQRPDEMNIENDMTGFSLAGVDLGELVSEVTADAEAEADVRPSEEKADDPILPLEDVFPIDSMEEISLAEMPLPEESTGGIDLGNLGEEDLMNLLAGTDGLSDIGDMLQQSENPDAPIEGMDVFETFAQGEMAANNETIHEEKNENQTKNKKGGFMEKISSFFHMLLKDHGEEENLTIKPTLPPGAVELSDENAEILAAFGELDGMDMPSAADKKGKKEKKKKDKPKKEKPKKEKPKKEKKPKEPKPKKEKKPKEVDLTPPLPRGPVIMIWVFVGSLFALVLLAANLIPYSSSISSAKNYSDKGQYAQAYKELLGVKIKAADMDLYNQLSVLAAVDGEISAFDSFYANDRQEEALDSLICAAGRCELNEENAALYGCEGQLTVLRTEVSNKLRDYYGMTYEDALELYHAKSRELYTIALQKKLKELGIR